MQRNDAIRALDIYRRANQQVCFILQVIICLKMLLLYIDLQSISFVSFFLDCRQRGFLNFMKCAKVFTLVVERII
jgi:hypothetical protein